MIQTNPQSVRPAFSGVCRSTKSRAARLLQPGDFADELGFTLLELVVALAILAIAAAIVLPQARTGSDVVSLRSTAIQLAASLRATRAAAKSASRETTFVLDLAHRRYWGDGNARPQAIPRRLVVEAGHHPGEALDIDRSTVRFLPDGSASGGWIRLRSRHGAADLTIDWLTGSTDIVWVR